MKRMGFAAIPDRSHYWLADARAQACLIEGNPPGEPDFEGLVRCDLEIRDGRIATIAPPGRAPAGAVDLRGGLVWPGFVDVHTHLDKGHIWPRSPNPDGSFLGAVDTTLGDRAARWSAEDVRRRMEFGLACAWAQGTVAVRTHIDSLAPQAEISWPVLKALRDAWSGRIELQATCLMSMDAFAEPQGVRLADIVAEAGGVLGCSTRLNGGAHEALPPGFLELLESIFRMAMDRGLDMDLHVDESGDLGAKALIEIARMAARLGFKGRLQCGHCCSLAMQPDTFVADTLRAVADAGIAIVSLPMCNMYLQGRTAGRTPRWRGITLLHELRGEGIPVSIASDNCRDPFHAFGDHDMLEVMTQATRIAHLDHPFGDWPTSFTSVPADVMGLPDHGRLKVGAPADLVLLSARFMSEMLSRSQADRIVLRAGRAIDTSLPDYRELDGLLGGAGVIATDPAFRAQLDGLELIDHPVQLRLRSRDFYWYSPILKAELDGKAADLIVVPHTVDEVARVAAACARFSVPLVVRGGATGNYGQMVPLQGGVLLDMARLDRPLWVERGRGRFEAGVRLGDADVLCQKQGWELRMFPSTRRQATVGGYVCGGAAGVGSIRYGQLRDAGSVLALKVVTCEPTPRLIELRGADIGKALHAYGTTSIVVEVELALAPAYPWVEMVAAFDDFAAAAHFAQALGESDGIFLKLDSLMAWPLPRYFRGLEEGALPEGRHIVMIMAAAGNAGTVRDLVRGRGGAITLERRYVEDRAVTPLYEYTWNHTTLQALKVDKTVTYLQTIFPLGANVEALIASHEMFGEEVMAHAEFQRRQGCTNCSSLQVVRYSDEARLWEIVRGMETLGIRLSNPHSYILEDKGARVLSADLQLAFKREADPQGLLNPGKMSRWMA